MKFESTDILLVEADDGSIAVVEAPSNMADVGSIVLYDGSKCGTVTKRTFIGRDQSFYDLIQSVAEVYPAEKIFLPYWEKEPACDADS